MLFRGEKTGNRLAILKQLITIFWAEQPIRAAVYLSIKIIASLIPSAQIVVTQKLVDEAAVLFSGHGNIARVSLYLSVQMLLFVMLSALLGLERHQFAIIQIGIKRYFQEKIAGQAVRLPLAVFDSPGYYDKFHQATYAQSKANILNSLFSGIQSMITLVSFLAILSGVSPWLSAALLLYIVPSLLVNLRIGKSRFAQMIHQTPLSRKTDYFFLLLTRKEFAKEIRIFNSASFLLDGWRHMFGKTASEQLNLEKRAALKVLGVDSFGVLLQHGLIALLLYFGWLGRLTVGAYVSLAQTIVASQSLIQRLAADLAMVFESSYYVSEMMAFIDGKREDTQETGAAARFPDPIKQGIKVSGVDFAYPNRPVKVLKELSLEIRPGEKVAIVGENGAGKSTLAKCLLGLYKPDKGTIEIDGIPIGHFDPEDFRSHVSALFQDFVRYEMTAAENIALADAASRMEEIRSAAKRAGVLDLIEQMPHQFDTQLGTMFGEGRELSYGQWQRIALARAFFRKSRIIVLDEPTASMDPVTEQAIMRTLCELMKDQTAIVITHRLSLCPLMDNIFVLKEGRLVESGTHESLIRLGGEYAKMYRLQRESLKGIYSEVI